MLRSEQEQQRTDVIGGHADGLAVEVLKCGVDAACGGRLVDPVEDLSLG
jgi:hypothetical protein